MIDYKGKVEKALECDEMVKLLEGKEEYHCEYVWYGMPPDADVTDWANLLDRGIYPVYNEKKYNHIPEKIMDAITEMCKGDTEEIYCAFRVFFRLAIDEQNETYPAPFQISEQMKPVVMKAVFENKEKLKKNTDWEGWRQADGMWGAIKRWVNILKNVYGVCLEYDMEAVE